MRTGKIHLTIAIVFLNFVFVVGTLMAADIEEEKEAREREEKIIQNTDSSFVIIHYHFKKSERPEPFDDRTAQDPEKQDMLKKILAKKTLGIVGVIIKDNEIFTIDNYILPEVVEKITVTGPDGQTLNARQDRILSKTAGQIIHIIDPIPRGWKALNFVEGPHVLDIKSKLYGVSLRLDIDKALLNKVAEDGRFSMEGAQPIRKRDNQTNVPDYFGIDCNENIKVVCDSNGAVLGVTALDKIETSKTAPAWQGSDILADVGIKRQMGEEEIKKNFSKYLYQVMITFRPPPEEDEEYDFGRFSSFFGRSSRIGGFGKEMFAYGLAVDSDTLLLPIVMPQMLVSGIDTITVDVNGQSIPAAFSGVLKDCEATVIKLKEGKLLNVVSIDPEVTLTRIEPFWAVFARELAGKDLVVNHSRWISKVQGYENKLYRQVENNVRGGSWLLDSQGQFAGLYTRPRREYHRILPYLMGQDFGFLDADMMSFGRIRRKLSGKWPSPLLDDEHMQIFDTSILSLIFTDLSSNYDPHIRHLSKDEQKRRVWLGVEFTGVDKEMSKQLNLSKQTQDGRIGLMINRVYPSSPASRMGLVEGDILLKLKVPDAPWPIELRSRSAIDFARPDFEDLDVPEEVEMMGYRAPRRRPWPSRDNFFTSMLKTIGEGISAQLIYIHNGEELQKEFVIEQSPRDSLSANKYKDRKLGITVKDLTYEVRTGLKLNEDDKAIVVSKVEPGTPAALARISTFELLRAVEGESISSVKDFKTAIEDAKQQGKESVRVTVEWMGKTRLTDLKFEAKGRGLREMMKSFPSFPGGSQESDF